MLPFNETAEASNFLCHLGAGHRVKSLSIVNALFISFK